MRTYVIHPLPLYTIRTTYKHMPYSAFGAFRPHDCLDLRRMWCRHGGVNSAQWVHRLQSLFFCYGISYTIAPLRLPLPGKVSPRSEEHTSELQPLMRISYAVFCLKKK